MAILSVDVAYRTYRDIGAVLLENVKGEIRCQPIRPDNNEPPSPHALASLLNDICVRNSIHVLLLDGPQGWKADDNGLQHSRHCERELNTPAKTGRPWEVKPAGYLKFVEFSIRLFDVMCEFGWERLSNPRGSLGAGRWLIESFPLSAWRELRLPSLPSKQKCRGKNLDCYVKGLTRLFPLRPVSGLTHDEIQATVAGLAGLAVESGEWNCCRWAGVPPKFMDGHWREGFIVNRLPPQNGQSAGE